MGNELEWPDRIGPTIQGLLRTPHQEMGPRGIGRSSANPLHRPSLPTLKPCIFHSFKASSLNASRQSKRNFPGPCTWDAGPTGAQNVLGRGALGSVDVFSVNVYDSRVRSGKYPRMPTFRYFRVNFILERWTVGTQPRSLRFLGSTATGPVLCSLFIIRPG